MEQKTGILVVSFGTAYPDTREKTIGAIEKAIAAAFPRAALYRAFTSGMVLRRISREENLHIDTPAHAMARAAGDGVRELTVQPTLFLPGREFSRLEQIVEEHRGLFDRVTLGAPLIGGTEDCLAVARILYREAGAWDDGNTAVCFMGHGTDTEANRVYEDLQQALTASGSRPVFIGTLGGVDTLLGAVSSGSCRRVVLQPLMVVAGSHASRDMAHSTPDSWASRFRAAGFEVQCVLRGLGELEDIQNIYAAHAKAAD